MEVKMGRKEKLYNIQNIIDLINSIQEININIERNINKHITEDKLLKYVETIRLIFSGGKIIIKIAHEKLAIALNIYRKIKSDVIVKESEFIHWLHKEKPLFFYYGTPHSNTKNPSFDYFKMGYSQHKNYFPITVDYPGFKFNDISWHDLTIHSLKKMKWILDDLRNRGEMEQGKPLAFLLENYDPIKIQSLFGIDHIKIIDTYLINLNNKNITKFNNDIQNDDNIYIFC